MVEKGSRGGVWHTIHRYAKANNKCMRNYDKREQSLYLKHWDVNNIYGWTRSQNFRVNGFLLVEKSI